MFVRVENSVCTYYHQRTVINNKRYSKHTLLSYDLKIEIVRTCFFWLVNAGIDGNVGREKVIQQESQLVS